MFKLFFFTQRFICCVLKLGNRSFTCFVTPQVYCCVRKECSNVQHLRDLIIPSVGGKDWYRFLVWSNPSAISGAISIYVLKTKSDLGLDTTLRIITITMITIMFTITIVFTIIIHNHNQNHEYKAWPSPQS